MTWTLNTIVSASHLRVSLGISANGSRLCAVPNKTVQMFNFKTKVK